MRIDRLLTNLSGRNEVLMLTENYSFSTKFAWLNDKFGVLCLLNLEL